MKTEMNLTMKPPVFAYFRHLLHNCFQALMDHGVRISEILAEAYGQHCCVANFADSYSREKAVQLGFSLGQFTMWLALSHSKSCRTHIRPYTDTDPSVDKIPCADLLDPHVLKPSMIWTRCELYTMAIVQCQNYLLLTWKNLIRTFIWVAS